MGYDSGKFQDRVGIVANNKVKRVIIETGLSNTPEQYTRVVIYRQRSKSPHYHVHKDSLWNLRRACMRMQKDSEIAFHNHIALSTDGSFSMWYNFDE